jgi:hypothetical protein
MSQDTLIKVAKCIKWMRKEIAAIAACQSRFDSGFHIIRLRLSKFFSIISIKKIGSYFHEPILYTIIIPLNLLT